MPPRPFPFGLRVGTDICKISRLRAIFTRRSNGSPLRPLSRFLKRVLTEPERNHFWHRFGPPETIHTKLEAVAQFLAGRFAAKEACRKACGHLDEHSRGFHRIMILPVSASTGVEHKSSAPQGLVLDKIYEEIGTTSVSPQCEHPIGVPKASGDSLDTLEGQLCELSISHDGDFATAIALVPTIHVYEANSPSRTSVNHDIRSSTAELSIANSKSRRDAGHISDFKQSSLAN